MSEQRRPDCEGFDLSLGELAAGVIDAAEMPLLATHLEGCLRCRLTLDELTATADRLSLLGPETEPPPGFEARALASFRTAEHSAAASSAGTGPTRFTTRKVLVVALSAAAVIALVVGVALTRATNTDGVTASTLDRVHVSDVRTARLLGADGRAVGSVIQLTGERTTYVMSLDRPAPGDAYRCEVTSPRGPDEALGWWTADGSNHSWTVETTRTPTATDDIRLVSKGGSVWATASLDR